MTKSRTGEVLSKLAPESVNEAHFTANKMKFGTGDKMMTIRVGDSLNTKSLGPVTVVGFGDLPGGGGMGIEVTLDANPGVTNTIHYSDIK